MLLDEDPPELFPQMVYSDQSVLESGLDGSVVR